MGTIDLDALSAARREGKKERPTVTFAGSTFELPVEMPFAVIEAVGRMSQIDITGEEDTMAKNAEMSEAMADVARSLFGRRFREFLDLGPSVEDITALLSAIATEYGTSSGESPASV